MLRLVKAISNKRDRSPRELARNALLPVASHIQQFAYLLQASLRLNPTDISTAIDLISATPHLQQWAQSGMLLPSSPGFTYILT